MRVAIVGGSLGGLFAAVLLKAKGHQVTLYERSRSGLEGRGAGLVAQREIFAILRTVGCEHVAQIGVVAKERITLDHGGRVIERVATPQMQISWDRLYRAFRERIDSSEYLLGRGVAEVGQTDDNAWLRLDDGSAVEADLIVGADGVGSIVRLAVVGDTGQPHYAGYVAWRGLFPERLLPAEAAESLLDRFAFYQMDRSHILGYVVAGPGGEVDAGHRRYNWVWYRRADPLQSILIDSRGASHRFSLAPGAVRPEARKALLADASKLLPPQFLAAVEVEENPFIQAIFDYEAPRMIKDRLILLGDAAFVVRPHTAMGVAKAAGDALALSHVLTDDFAQGLAEYHADRVNAGRSIASYGMRLGASFA